MPHLGVLLALLLLHPVLCLLEVAHLLVEHVGLGDLVAREALVVVGQRGHRDLLGRPPSRVAIASEGLKAFLVVLVLGGEGPGKVILRRLVDPLLLELSIARWALRGEVHELFQVHKQLLRLGRARVRVQALLDEVLGDSVVLQLTRSDGCAQECLLVCGVPAQGRLGIVEGVLPPLHPQTGLCTVGVQRHRHRLIAGAVHQAQAPGPLCLRIVVLLRAEKGVALILPGLRCQRRGIAHAAHAL
mmetsp:Transcript_38999/g.87825  ORF Transcript_38999/g.87825 Transcript_38999/m.87825 type:complete len:244 (+) Transcript_38999:294-1025(+)